MYIYDHLQAIHITIYSFFCLCFVHWEWGGGVWEWIDKITISTENVIKLQRRKIKLKPMQIFAMKSVHSFVEIDHEIFSTVILSLPLIQEGQFSVSGERMCTILVNP